jgi:hypothetical protein
MKLPDRYTLLPIHLLNSSYFRPLFSTLFLLLRQIVKFHILSKHTFSAMCTNLLIENTTYFL